MAKLNGYCINSVASEFDVMLMHTDRKTVNCMPIEHWQKLSMHVNYAFDDRCQYPHV